MIFVVEHEKSGKPKIDILIDVNEIDTSQFEKVKKLFFCESMQEASFVYDELRQQLKTGDCGK